MIEAEDTQSKESCQHISKTSDNYKALCVRWKTFVNISVSRTEF